MTALLSREKLEKWIESNIYGFPHDGTLHVYYAQIMEAIESGKLDAPSPSSSCQEGSISSETNCPTCGSAVTVGGDGETHYYIPVSHGGWLPMESALKTRIIWLACEHSMRLGYWMEGKQHECHGSVGGGWKDFAISEAHSAPMDLRFAPTKWHPTPDLFPHQPQGDA